MEFSELLKSYMKDLHITAKELAETTELSPSVISRYRSGERVPAIDSQQLEAIVKALGKKAKEVEHPTLGKKVIRAAFAEALANKESSGAELAPRLSALMEVLGISQAELARGSEYDPSQLSRIRKGQRMPADLAHFTNAVASYISSQYTTSEQRKTLENLIQTDVLTSQKQVADAIEAYLIATGDAPLEVAPATAEKKEKKEKKSEKSEQPKQKSKATLTEEEHKIEALLGRIDAFHLQQFLRRLSKNSERKAIISKFAERFTSTYKNISEIRQGILFFLQEIGKESIPGPLYWEDDVTGGLSAMTTAQQQQFCTELIHVLQGNHSLCIAESVEPDYDAVMANVELWLPLYMVGNMRSYRTTPGGKEDYRNLSIFTEENILYGTSVSTRSNEALAYRKKGTTEISYAMEQFQKLIAEGQSLITVYRKSQRNSFHRYLKTYIPQKARRISYCNTLPLATMSEPLLNSILEANQVDAADCERIRHFWDYQRQQLKYAVTESEVTYIYPVISKEQFATHPLTLDLSELFLGGTIFYSYEEYEQHLASTRTFAKTNMRLTLKELNHIPFAHLSITWKQGMPVILSKDVSPATHWVISDPILTKVIGNYLTKL
ncbi:MAG: helix-turn-helix domain-containing protein [Lachnospiraceae bacterium]|nr:helix-turn-helix domain-containing protein [Lachnospiraceae bacterium]